MSTNDTATTTAPGAILRSYSMDYTTQIEHARNADGVWFRRYQYRDPRYGYKWSRWQASSAPLGFTSETGRTARLPKS